MLSCCLLYSLVCSFISLLNNTWRTVFVLEKRELKEWEITIKIVLSLLKGCLESIYGTFIFMTPYIGCTGYVFGFFFAIFFSLAMINIIVENLMELKAYKIFSEYEVNEVSDDLQMTFSCLGVVVILVLVGSTLAQAPIIYSVLLSCFESTLPKNIISGLSGFIAFVFASQIFIKQHDQFEDAAVSCVEFSHWFSGSKP